MKWKIWINKKTYPRSSCSIFFFVPAWNVWIMGKTEGMKNERNKIWKKKNKNIGHTFILFWFLPLNKLKKSKLLTNTINSSFLISFFHYLQCYSSVSMAGIWRYSLVVDHRIFVKIQNKNGIVIVYSSGVMYIFNKTIIQY